MNAKPWRSRSWNSGITRTPATPQTTRSPVRTSRSLRHAARALLDHDDRVHPLALDLDPLAADGAPASGGSWSSRSRRARSRRGRPVASSASCWSARRQPSATSSSSTCPSACSVGAEIRIEMDDGSSLLRPMSNLQHVERRVALDDGVEDDVQDLRVDQVAFGLDDLAESRQRSADVSPCQEKIGSASGGWT